MNNKEKPNVENIKKEIKGAEELKETLNPSEQMSSKEEKDINEKDMVADNMDKSVEKTEEKIVVKKGGTALAILAILIALGIGGVGYYCGQKQIAEFQSKFTQLEQQIQNKTNVVTQSNSSTDYANITSKLTALSDILNKNNEKISFLEKDISVKEQAISALQVKLNQLGAGAQAATQSNDILLSESVSLLNHALQKLALDNDIDTSVASLKEADKVLAKSSNPEMISVRKAINDDIKQLLSINSVDENALMQRLSELANAVDNLVILNTDFSTEDNGKISESIDDWKENATKAATSFLNHFIRITPKNADVKELLAPNQEIYLRENIRLRLQIAIMAIPRQQNDLYKQSLNLVATWVRSYFDTNSEATQVFLKEIDELTEQSIYVDLPTELTSLSVLEKLSGKSSKGIYKPEIKVDKLLSEKNSEILKKESETIKNSEISPKTVNETQQ
ncbi:hypothetical protein A6A11_00470 [Bisgaardia hudsonensis]|nr:hypothetical protein A6A11_00470 [Bisgaardia hudsonensis]